MLFFAVILGVSILVRVAGVLNIAPPVGWPVAMRWGMAAGLVLFGLDHIVTPGRYVPMIPSVVPFPGEVVLFTGLCEIAGAVGLLTPKIRRITGIILALYFVCVFPANIKVAVEGLAVEGLPTSPVYYWVRLAFQPLAIWWALYSAQVIGPHRPGLRKRDPSGKSVQAIPPQCVAVSPDALTRNPNCKA